MPENEKLNAGQLLKRQIRMTGVSQEDAARLAGVNFTYLSRKMREEKIPESLYQRLSAGLGVSVDFLKGKEDAEVGEGDQTEEGFLRELLKEKEEQIRMLLELLRGQQIISESQQVAISEILKEKKV
jgi:transcriptional regulator with XRE-family HTH domain